MFFHSSLIEEKRPRPDLAEGVSTWRGIKGDHTRERSPQSCAIPPACYPVYLSGTPGEDLGQHGLGKGDPDFSGEHLLPVRLAVEEPDLQECSRRRKVEYREAAVLGRCLRLQAP